MTSALFPTYFLARLVVQRGWALFAAAGAAAIPSLAYSSWIVEETVAYPYAALCFYIIAKAADRKSRGWVAAAIGRVARSARSCAASSSSSHCRGFAVFFAAWSSDWGRDPRAKWSNGDYIGVFVWRRPDHHGQRLREPPLPTPGMR